MRSGALFMAAHRESGGGEEGDHQFMAFHKCVFGCVPSLQLLTKARREHPLWRTRHKRFAQDEMNPFFGGSDVGGRVAAQFVSAAGVPDALSLAKPGDDVVVAVAVS